MTANIAIDHIGDELFGREAFAPKDGEAWITDQL